MSDPEDREESGLKVKIAGGPLSIAGVLIILSALVSQMLPEKFLFDRLSSVQYVATLLVGLVLAVTAPLASAIDSELSRRHKLQRELARRDRLP